MVQDAAVMFLLWGFIPYLNTYLPLITFLSHIEIMWGVVYCTQ